METTLVTLTTENRDDLLRPTVDGMRHRLAEAPAIIARLQELNPDLAHDIRAKEHALSDLVLRMLCPSSSMNEDGSVTVPSFIAVSYCWHYKDWSLAPAAQPVTPHWEISQPMVDAIMTMPELRARPDEGVWLDRLSIDQKNEQEKTVAIGAMDVIYRAARRIAILLEDVQLDAQQEAAALLYAGFYADLCEEVRTCGLEGQAKSDFVDGYFDARETALPPAATTSATGSLADLTAAAKAFALNLLGGRWFARAWCAHESRVAPHTKTTNPLFLCFGHDGRVLAFEFRFVHYLALRLTYSEPDPPVGPDYFSFLNDPNPQTLRQRWSRLHRLMGVRAAEDSSTAPTQHVVSMLPMRCLHMRDLVSIALNTAGLPLVYSGRFVDRGNVIWIFSAIAIAAGDVVPLLMTGRKLRIVDKDESRTVVSWVIDPVSAVVDDRLPSRLTASVTGVTREYIELDLLLFTGRPLQASEAALAAAKSLLEQHTNLFGYGTGPSLQNEEESAEEAVRSLRMDTNRIFGLVSGELHRVAGSDRLVHSYAPTFLALAIDCGIDWIVRFPDTMTNNEINMRDDPEPWLHGELGRDEDPRFAGIATDLLAHFEVTQANNSNFETHYFSPAVRFFTCLADPRLTFLTLNPRRVQVRDNDWAITTTTSNRSYLAAPLALASLPPWQERAWVVEPFDPAAPPERVEDHLPDAAAYAAAVAAENEGQVAVDYVPEDVFPVLSSDYGDRRAVRDDKRATWRLRSRHKMFGCQPIEVDGHTVIHLKKQKVYGSEDYDWHAIRQATVEHAADTAKREDASA